MASPSMKLTISGTTSPVGQVVLEGDKIKQGDYFDFSLDLLKHSGSCLFVVSGAIRYHGKEGSY